MKRKSGSFLELEVWKKSRTLYNDIAELTKKFSADERYRLSDQIIRSSRSICSNIAEGHGRYHYQENIQYCRIARGSLSETLNHLICALDCKYIDENEYNTLAESIDQIERIMNGYIKYLKSQKSTKT